MAEAQSSGAYCVAEQKPCVQWVEKYFKDCLCNISDDFSFALGFASLICWAVAEIPQIVTNFRTKSSHGVSLLFLLTWIAGDIFNLVGCLLEPATLPTQFYTALLYTLSTVVLVLQSLYYDYLYRWWKGKNDADDSNQLVEETKKPLHKSSDSSIPIPAGLQQPVDYYYTSARSMAGSATPPFRSNLWPVKSGPSALGMENDSSSDEEEAPARNSTTQPKPIPRSAGYGAFLTASISIPHKTNALVPVYAALGGRKLLQGGGTGHSSFGEWLGWMMAAIYMGGRIPQIWLNGLNPLMFIFALIANATYMGSILVRTTAWDKIKPNLPWLLDAAVCVVLDLFIILQYIYYKYCRKNSGGSKEHFGDYSTLSK